jgi:hypothetical protein
MARKVVEISGGEANVIADLFHERDLAMKALTAITQLICARENISVASLAGLTGTSLLLDVPDDPALKLVRTESPQTDLGVLGAVQEGNPPANGQSGPALGLMDHSRGDGNVPIGHPGVPCDDLPGDTGHASR